MANNKPSAVRREPVTFTNLLLTLVQAIIAMLTSFQLIKFTPDQTGTVIVVASAVATLVNATFVRNRVTPMRDPRDENGKHLVTAKAKPKNRPQRQRTPQQPQQPDVQLDTVKKAA